MKPIYRIKIKLFLLDLAFNVVAFSLIGVFAYINEKMIESVSFYIAWVGLRYLMPKIFHYKFSDKPINNILGCLLWSTIIFYIVIVGIFPIHISIFISVVISCAINFILYKMQDYIDLKKFHAENTDFRIETATKDQIEKCCKLLNYKKYKIDIAVKFFVDKLSHDEIWSYMNGIKRNVSLDTVMQYKYRILKDLKKFENKKLDTH